MRMRGDDACSSLYALSRLIYYGRRQVFLSYCGKHQLQIEKKKVLLILEGSFPTITFTRYARDPENNQKHILLLFLPLDRHYKSRFTSPYTTTQIFASSLTGLLGVMATDMWNIFLYSQTVGPKFCLLLKTQAVIWKKNQAITCFSPELQHKGKETRGRGIPCGATLAGLRQEAGATVLKLVRNGDVRCKQQSRTH